MRKTSLTAEGAEDAEKRPDAITEQIIGAAIEVHRCLGPGLLESAYEACLSYELLRLGLRVERQVPLPVRYKEVSLECGYRLDLLVERQVICELKAVERLHDIHQAQVLSYLRLSRLKVGLLINFHQTTLKAGLRRISLDHESP
jgi:GxxExxY protein